MVVGLFMNVVFSMTTNGLMETKVQSTTSLGRLIKVLLEERTQVRKKLNSAAFPSEFRSKFLNYFALICKIPTGEVEQQQRTYSAFQLPRSEFSR